MRPSEPHLTLLESEFERVLDEHAAAVPRIAESRSAKEVLRERGASAGSGSCSMRFPPRVYTTDAFGRITFCNEAAVELGAIARNSAGASGAAPRAFRPDGRPLPHDECPMAVALKENRCVRGEEAVAERPDGSRVPFIPFPTPLHDSSGKPVGAVNMLVDITERKRAEERQALLVRELHHRVKNMLATVQAIAGSTAGPAPRWRSSNSPSQVESWRSPDAFASGGGPAAGGFDPRSPVRRARAL